MGPLPRFAKIALASTFLLALASLPVTFEERIPGNGVAPTVAWAGGSPDETLKPQPPKACRVANVNERDADASWKSFRAAVAKLKSADRWQVFYRIILTSTHRF